MPSPEQLRATFDSLSREKRESKRASLTHGLALASLKKRHRAKWERFLATLDEGEWDAWLMRVGVAALELRDSYQRRRDCEHGTAYDGCACYGCNERALRGVQTSIEGSAAGSAGLAVRWTESEKLLQGMKLHAWWVHGTKTKGADLVGAYTGPVRRHGPINWRSWRRSGLELATVHDERLREALEADDG